MVDSFTRRQPTVEVDIGVFGFFWARQLPHTLDTHLVILPLVSQSRVLPSMSVSRKVTILSTEDVV